MTDDHEHACRGVACRRIEAAGRAVCVLALLEAIQVTARQERELEAEIIGRLEVHADAKVFTSLPGMTRCPLLGKSRARQGDWEPGGVDCTSSRGQAAAASSACNPGVS